MEYRDDLIENDYDVDEKDIVMCGNCGRLVDNSLLGFVDGHTVCPNCK